MRKDLFSHMEKLPIKYFDTHAHGDIMSVYTNDIDTLRQMISQSIPQFLNSGITIISTFISMLILSIPLSAVTLIMVGDYAVLYRRKRPDRVVNILPDSRRILVRSMVISRK